MMEHNIFKEEIIKFIIENDKTLEEGNLSNLPIVQLVIIKTEIEIKKNINNMMSDNTNS